MAYLPILDDRHNNLALARTVTSNVPRELLHIRYKLRQLRLRSSSADAAPEGNGLACYLTVERAEQELLRVRRVEKVKAAPVDAR